MKIREILKETKYEKFVNKYISKFFLACIHHACQLRNNHSDVNPAKLIWDRYKFCNYEITTVMLTLPAPMHMTDTSFAISK